MVGGGEVGVEATFADGEDSGVGGEGAEKPQVGWCGDKDIPRMDANGVVISGKQYWGAAGGQDWSGGGELGGAGAREECGGGDGVQCGGAAEVLGAGRGCWS